jgi:hypothetical protein
MYAYINISCAGDRAFFQHVIIHPGLLCVLLGKNGSVSENALNGARPWLECECGASDWIPRTCIDTTDYAQQRAYHLHAHISAAAL